MQYLLVENKQIIHLGPVHWRHRFIQSELDDLEVEFQVSPVEPNEYVKINDTLEIYPVSGLNIPEHDSTYQQLEGPHWTYEDGMAVGSYNVVEKDLNVVRNELKTLAAAERYKKEISGIKLTIQDTEVSVATDRDSRNVYTQKLVSMGDTPVQWKFPEGWLTLTKQELNDMLVSVTNHVQAQYDWEINIGNEIDSATSSVDLKSIVIVENQTNGLV